MTHSLPRAVAWAASTLTPDGFQGIMAAHCIRRMSMARQRLLVELKFHGSGTGPQTPRPHGAASCGHAAHAHTQGLSLPRAMLSPVSAV